MASPYRRPSDNNLGSNESGYNPNPSTARPSSAFMQAAERAAETGTPNLGGFGASSASSPLNTGPSLNNPPPSFPIPEQAAGRAILSPSSSTEFVPLDSTNAHIPISRSLSPHPSPPIPQRPSSSASASRAPRAQTAFSARRAGSSERAWISSLIASRENRRVVIALAGFTAMLVLYSSMTSSSTIGSNWSRNTDFPEPKLVNVGVRPRVGFGGPPYKFVVVEDGDKFNSLVNDKGKTVWRSSLKYGVLVEDDSGKWSLVWPDPDEGDSGEIILDGFHTEAGRGLELSELIYWKGELLAPDDRTGIIYAIYGSRVVPRYILSDGDGVQSKGFKCEWMTIRDHHLYVGSMGKEFTNKDGMVVSTSSMYIKTISVTGVIEHHDWGGEYSAMRRATGTEFPGYMIHEAVGWHAPSKKWVILPRRVSKEPYNDELDERKGSNMMMIATDLFEDAEISYIGNADETHGWSSFKWIPGRPNLIAALRTKELVDVVESFIIVFDMETGKVLLPETKIGDKKYEGIEFV